MFVYERGWDLTSVRRRVEWPGARGGRHAWTLDRLAWMPIIHELQTMKLPERAESVGAACGAACDVRDDWNDLAYLSNAYDEPTPSYP